MNLNKYYRHPAINSGLRNFFDGCTWFLTSGSQYSRDPNWGKEPKVRVFPIEELELHLGEGPDIYRPLLSSSGVLGVFDIEYFHWDKTVLFKSQDRKYDVRTNIFKGELEPVYRYISSSLGNECISDITWSGYHFLTNIDRNSQVYKKLLGLGQGRRENNTPKCLEQSLIEQYGQVDWNDLKRRSPVSWEDGVVYQQFGRVLDYLSHKVIREIQPELNLRITISDTQEEGISLDLSQYADPVYMRIIRTILSSWDKHNSIESLSWIVGEPPFLDVIRRFQDQENNDLDLLFSLHRDYDAAARYHQQFSGFIPSAGDNLLRLAEEYERSELFRFHQDFDSVEHDPNDDNYKRAKFDNSLNFEIRQWMELPNPTLLQPGNIKRMVEHLLDKGWHPKHIGGMLAGRYEANDKGWDKKYWSKYNTRTRANFWARTYAGLKMI